MNTDDATADLQALHQRYRGLREGRVAGYIPELAKADPEAFAIAMVGVDGRVVQVGDSEARFTLQSMSKPLAYGLALQQLGREAVHRKVGVEPTGEAFNSIVELEEEVHRPYNPMINSGAITIAALLHEAAPGQAATRLMHMVQAYLGRPVTADEPTLRSELATGHRNRAIAHLLHHYGVIGPDIQAVLQLYSLQCSLQVGTLDLALVAATLAHRGVQPLTGRQVLAPALVRDMLSLMFTCGMYDTAGEWAYTVGLPAKSGVSGGILAVVPGRMGLAVYSPRLDAHGHSVRGMAVLKALAAQWRLSLFGTG
ncbi:glutaminase A [Ramlibacter tataouinensis]|nr:glutaminase A [Ramlibacter tataouinensis]